MKQTTAIPLRLFATALLLVLGAFVPPSSTHATNAPSPHAVSVLSYGLRLTVETSRAAYPSGALVPVTVHLQNVSNQDVGIQPGCGGFVPVIFNFDAAGHAVREPQIPAGVRVPRCVDVLPVPQPIAPGATWTYSQLLILAGPELQAGINVALSRRATPQNGYDWKDLTTPILQLRTLPSTVTHAALQRSIHAITVDQSAGAPVYYSYSVQCTGPYIQRPGESSGTNGWTLLRGNTIALHLTSTCPYLFRWQAVVAAVGKAPVWFDYRPPAPPAPDGSTLTAPACNSVPLSTREAVALVWRGGVFLASPSGICRVTASIGAFGARLSPDLRHVAFYAPRPGNRTLRPLWTVTLHGTAPPHPIAEAYYDNYQPTITWSPDSQYVAASSRSVVDVWNAQGRFVSRVLPAMQFGAGTFLAWLPTSKAVLAVGGVSAEEGVREAHLLIGPLAGQPSGRVVHFPTWISSPNFVPHGSFPWDDIAISEDGRHVFLITTGGGVRVSGVWEAPITGGSARLAIGTPARVRGYPAPAAHLDDATHLQGSPDGHTILLDPGTRFWLADSRTLRGRFLTPAVSPGCVISQSTYTADSRGIAYVTICRSPHGLFRTTLSILPFAGPGRQILTLTDLVPDAASIAPTYRCLGCGYNPGL